MTEDDLEQKLEEYQNNLNNYLKFLTSYKNMLGLDKFNIFLANRPSEEPLDEIEIEYQKRNISIILSHDFLFLSDNQKIDHLINTIVEARIQLFQEETLDVTERYRNELIQDIARGLTNVHVLRLDQEGKHK